MLLGLSPSSIDAQATAAGEAFFSSAGVRIRYIDRGSGEPVVLIHGYTGTADRHFVAPGVVSNLEKDHRIIALDLRGHGGSDKPHDPKAFGAEMGRDIIRLLDHLGLRRAHIVGYSLGAHIAAWLLTEQPERVATATLVASAPSVGWSSQAASAAEAAAIELESDVPFRSLILRLTPPDRPRPAEAELRALSQSIAARNDVRALAALQRGLHGLAVTNAQMAAVRTPTLGVVGTADRNVAAMRELKTVLARLELVAVEGATHGGEQGILRRPEFLDALRRLVAANKVAR